jgi:GH15 family glucan-1,4-alpha-glucosidase
MRPTTDCPGKEGTFLICSFWLVSAQAIVGEMKRATDLMERLLRIRSRRVTARRTKSRWSARCRTS